MSILFLAPLPPPITGHSIAAKVLYDYLSVDHKVTLVDLSIESAHDGTVTISRCWAVLKAIRKIWRIRTTRDIVYLTISESLAGNLKDLLIYLICFNRLDRLYIHLHGGSIKKELFDKYPIIKWFNKIFIKKMSGAIVSGHSHIDVFSPMMDSKKIHIIPNFAEDYLFVDEPFITEKFSKTVPLKIVYISGLTSKKGYLHLLNAYKELSQDLKEKVQLDFAGKFDNPEEQTSFESDIKTENKIKYHGVVSESKKSKLFADAHVFCLPTTFLEGQPISILEAYASGCAVLTTGQPGILDVFSDGVNGYEILEHDHLSIKNCIEMLLMTPNELSIIAVGNWRTALANYRASIFASSVGNTMLCSKD